ncbi:MAG: DUF808 domain-containing protein [Pseudomonadota bacterium]
MSTGLLALLDDVAAIAKVAAASLDDVVGQAARAGVKSAGVVIDDAAVAPRYVVGFASARELPIVRKIAVGSLKNKLLFLLPAALVLGLVAPWAITPLLMLGGAYLCYEGAEKIYAALVPHAAHAHGAKIGAAAPDPDPDPDPDPETLEDRKVAGAIRTDFILSAEIMAIALATMPGVGFWTQAAALALVGIGLTALVYGAVALLVKADDVGLALAQDKAPGPLHALGRRFGRALVVGMPGFLKALAVVGTAAMVWVGGGIVVHGLASFGLDLPEHVIHGVAHTAAAATPVLQGAVGWITGAAGAGIVGLALGALLQPVVDKLVAPAWSRLTGRRVSSPPG